MLKKEMVLERGKNMKKRKTSLLDCELKDFVQVLHIEGGTIARNLGFFSTQSGEIAWFTPASDGEPDIQVMTATELVEKIRSFNARVLKGNVTPYTPEGVYVLT